MRCARWNLMSPAVVAVVAAIGCGGGRPQDAGAATPDRAAAERPLVLAQAPDGAAAPAAGTASVTGSVKFDGAPPAAEKVKMDADPACKQQHATAQMAENVVVNGNGTLKHVFVFVKDGVQGAYPAPGTPVTLTQQGCWYAPRVFGIQVGQPLEIVNSDATLHNVNAKPTTNQPFNIAQPTQGMKTTKKFMKPEIGVTFKCNVHPWMRAFGHVLEHPFFGVTGDDGAFTLSGLPAGTYTVAAWHEQYGTQTQSVTVGDGESKSVTFTFKAQ